VYQIGYRLGSLSNLVIGVRAAGLNDLGKPNLASSATVALSGVSAITDSDRFGNDKRPDVWSAEPF
jgi:hypothetical protein